MEITLVGFMGSGKTTLAKALSDGLGYTFFDLDKIIEEKENCTIAEIFATKGETYFRKMERYILTDLLTNNKNYVLATGGGTACFFDNMENINKHCISLYLKMSADTLFDRLKDERSHRPLIKNFNDRELKQFIRNTLIEREPYYLKAHYKLKAKDIQTEALLLYLKQEELAK